MSNNSLPTKRFSRIVDGVSDIQVSVRLWRYWMYRAWINFKLSLNGARLGAIWPNISLALVVVTLGTVWGVILENGLGIEYYMYLLAGYPVWQLLANTVNRAARGLGSVGAGLSVSFSLFEKLAGSIIAFLIVAPLVIVGAIILVGSNFSHLWFLPIALLTLVFWCLGVLLLVAVLVTLKPDLKHLITSVMRLSFLATPIIWEPSRLGEYQSYLWFNPFFAPLEFARYSISGISYAPDVVWIAPLSALGLFFIGLVVFITFRQAVHSKVAR